MITVQVGQIGQASIEGRLWTSTDEALRRLLQDFTDGLVIHGGIPDVDEFILESAKATLPMTVIERRDPAPDPEATTGKIDSDVLRVY